MRPSTPPVTESRGDQSQLGTNSTPIAKKLSGSKPFTSEVNERNRKFDKLAEETKDMYRGPMPPESFLDSYLKVSSTPQIPNSLFQEVTKDEAGMASNFVCIPSMLISEFTNYLLFRSMRSRSM